MDIKDSVKIGNVETRNRIVMPPLDCQRAKEGRAGSAVRKFYADRCGSGKLGLVIVEHCCVLKQGQATPRQLSVADDSCIEGFSRLSSLIKASGTPVFCQISHSGLRAKPEITGMSPVSASADENGTKELSKDEIHAISAAFAAAALRVKKAGFDGVELHCAHRYLLDQFYSPIYNKRSDEYGGELRNRLRFCLETLSAVRAAVGPDFPISVRLGACDYMEGGNSIEDGVEAAKLLEEAGVDLLDISGGACGPSPDGRDEARFADASSAIKKAVSVPVMLTGGIRNTALAQELIEKGAADLIGVGTALFRNPRWAEENL